MENPWVHTVVKENNPIDRRLVAIVVQNSAGAPKTTPPGPLGLEEAVCCDAHRGANGHLIEGWTIHGCLGS